jgi:hypothetical protein
MTMPPGVVRRAERTRMDARAGAEHHGRFVHGCVAKWANGIAPHGFPHNHTVRDIQCGAQHCALRP